MSNYRRNKTPKNRSRHNYANKVYGKYEPQEVPTFHIHNYLFGFSRPGTKKRAVVKGLKTFAVKAVVILLLISAALGLGYGAAYGVNKVADFFREYTIAIVPRTAVQSGLGTVTPAPVEAPKPVEKPAEDKHLGSSTVESTKPVQLDPSGYALDSTSNQQIVRHGGHLSIDYLRFMYDKFADGNARVYPDSKRYNGTMKNVMCEQYKECVIVTFASNEAPGKAIIFENGSIFWDKDVTDQLSVERAIQVMVDEVNKK